MRRRELLGGIGALALAACAKTRDDPDPGPPPRLGGHPVPAGLPPGRLIAPTGRNPVLWVSDQPLDELEAGRRWAGLLAERARTRMWPLLLGGMLDGRRLRPWHTGELSVGSGPAKADLDQLFRSQWKRWERDDYYGPALRGEDKTLGPMPFAGWPGLAGAVKSSADPDRTAADLTGTAEGMDEVLRGSGESGPYLGLTVAPDGATALTTCGWYVDSPQEPGVVVRSWQQRFGVRVSTLGFDTLTVTVAWPPRTVDQARRLMAEHLLFCPDIFFQAEEPVSFEKYAHGLTEATTWTFWWD